MEIKKAAYCFDDELVADMPDYDVEDRYAPCMKCKTRKTPHRTQLCTECRKDNCVDCGRQVTRRKQRKRCHACEAGHARKLGRLLDAPHI